MERINDSNCRPKLGAIKDQGLTTGNMYTLAASLELGPHFIL